MERPHAQRSEAYAAGRHGASYALLTCAVALLAVISAYNFLLFHAAVELFTVAVAWSTFSIAWNARRFLDNHYVLLIGIASLFTGGIDVLHTLAYKGMNVFPGGDANPATQLWIAGRLMMAVSLLAAPLFIRRKLHTASAVAAYAAATALLIASIFAGVFPVCYVEGSGLTPFKIGSEYAIALILIAAMAVLYHRRREFDDRVWRQIAAFMLTAVASELVFTTYAAVDSSLNAAGHLLRFISACFLYRAIIVTGLVRPYNLLFRNLALSEEALRRSDERYRAFVARTSEGIVRIETEQPVPVSLPEDEQIAALLRHGYIAECNDAYARMHGASGAAAMTGSRPPETDLLRAFIHSGCEMAESVTCEIALDGGRRWIEGRFTGVIEHGCLVRAWGVQWDVTERRYATVERERLIRELQSALAEVKTLTGLLPICANCKKIRDDKGYWTQVESYLQQRVDVAFSHGICPDCLASLYPDYAPDGEEQERGRAASAESGAA